MKSINDYKSRVNKYGGIRGSILKSSQHNIDFSFEDSLSYEEVYINGSEQLTGVQVITDTKVPTIKYIVMRPNERISAGDIVFRTKLNQYWLCTGVDPNDLYCKGFIEMCNTTLKWVDDLGVIRSYPAVFYYGTKANFGVYSDRIMTVPDGRRQVVVQENEHTRKIRRDMRFIFGHSVFKVIDFDYVSDEGLVNINLKDDMFNNETDNLELGIADYYNRIKDNGNNQEPNEDDTNPPEDYKLMIKSKSSQANEIRLNQQKEYYAELYLGDDLVENASVNWELYSDNQIDATSLAAIVSKNGSSCIVKNQNSTSGFVQLKCFIENEDIEAWIRIQLKPLF